MIVIGFVAAAGTGAAVRHLVRVRTSHLWPIPVGTLLVNLVGSFALGLLAGVGPPASTIVGTAGLGALTTFSTFSAEVVELRAEGRSAVVAYVAVTVVGGITLAWCGLQLAA